MLDSRLDHGPATDSALGNEGCRKASGYQEDHYTTLAQHRKQPKSRRWPRSRSRCARGRVWFWSVIDSRVFLSLQRSGRRDHSSLRKCVVESARLVF